MRGAGLVFVLREDQWMGKSPIVIATASACPVCGQRLASSDPVCNECGAILALRMTRARRSTTVKSRVTALVHRQFAAVSSFVRDRRGYYIVAALLATALTAAAIAGVFAPRSAVEIRPPAERSVVKPPAVLDDQRQLERHDTTTRAASASTTHATRSPRGGWTTVGMFAAVVLGAVLGAVSVTSARRRRRRQRAADTPAGIASGRMTQAASVGAAFCFGLAVALAVVLAMESPVVQPPAAFATVEGERVDQWRRETSTLSERLSVLDARLASLESTRERAARQQPTRPVLERDPSRPSESGRAARPVDAAGEPERIGISSPAVPAHEEASTTISTADVLRPPRVATTTLGDRVWDDIVRDWARLTRSVRELFAGDAR
jgi:predicted nucleic acid-binding Zn ribbon protein